MQKPTIGEIVKQIVIALAIATIVGVPALGQELQTEPTATVVESDANGVNEPASTGQLSGTDWGLPLVKAMGGFGLVLCLILGGFYTARKVAPQYFNRGATTRLLKVVETLQMGEKRSISVVEVGEKRFLVGNTANQITLLAPLDSSFSLMIGDESSPRSNSPEAAAGFRNVLETEKSQLIRKAPRPKALPDDLRAKMQELRATLKV
jgi:flagellar biosynthetic protein FliO